MARTWVCALVMTVAAASVVEGLEIMVSSTITALARSPRLQPNSIRRRVSSQRNLSGESVDDGEGFSPKQTHQFHAIPLTPRLNINSSKKTTSTFLPTPDFDKALPMSPASNFFLPSGPSVKLVSTSLSGSGEGRSSGRTQKPKSPPKERVSTRIKRVFSARGITFGSSNDKLTRKWPTFRSSESRHRNVGGMREQLMENGSGLRLEAMDRWTNFKWCLLFSVLSLFVYGSICLLAALMVWFRAFMYADVIDVVDSDILILTTLAACVILLAFVTGLTGTLLNSRPILAIYALLLWPALLSMIAVGYVGYKRYAFALDRKLDHYWSQYFTPVGRLLIQNSLHCCGYFSPLHEATPSARCYSRTTLPGCKGKLLRFERENLQTIWKMSFSLAAVHLFNIIVSLICANHVTQPFGMRIPPRKYWLSADDVLNEAKRLLGKKAADDIARGDIWCQRPELTKAGSSTGCREDREVRYGR